MHGVAPQMCRSGSPSIVAEEPEVAPPAPSKAERLFGGLPGSGGGSLRRKETASPGSTIMRTGGDGNQLIDWRMAFAWLVAVAIASAIFFLPITRLVDSLGD